MDGIDPMDGMDAARRTDGVSWRRLVALCRKEVLQILRDPSSILIAFVLPVVMLFIFGFAINLDSTSIRMGLVMEDSGEEAQRFAAGFFGSPYMKVTVGTRAEMERAITEGRVRGFVVIPQDFSQQLDRPGESSPVQVITDGSEPNIAAFVENYARGTWQGWLRQRADAKGREVPREITLQSRFWFNPSAESRNYLVPGSITIIMTVIGAMLTSMVVAREWERGTMEALLATPVNKREIFLSKLIPYYGLGIAAMFLQVLTAVFILKIPFRGSVLLLWLVSTVFLFSALGLGLLLSTVTRNQFLAAQAALNAAFLPALMLSGFIYEIRSMPAPIRAVTCLIPARYFVNAVQSLFQAGNILGLLWRDVALLALAALFFLGLTVLKTRRNLE